LIPVAIGQSDVAQDGIEFQAFSELQPCVHRRGRRNGVAPPRKQTAHAHTGVVVIFDEENGAHTKPGAIAGVYDSGASVVAAVWRRASSADRKRSIVRLRRGKKRRLMNLERHRAEGTTVARLLAWPLTYAVMGGAILALDLVTGPYLLFPVFFVLPVALAAKYSRPSMAYFLSWLLPVARFFIAEYVDHPTPLLYTIANMLIRIAVLTFLAFLVARTARQARELRERFSGLVTICAWSGTIEHDGEWISFEQYLKRRFNLDTSHGMSPAEAQRMMAGLDRDDVRRASEPPA
jgi:hypothetical protein